MTTSEPYARKVLPFLKDEYFTTDSDQLVFTIAKDFILKYNALPSVDTLRIEIDSLADLHEDTVKASFDLLESFKNMEPENENWITDSTEVFCKDKAIYLAMTEALQIIDGKNKKLDKGAIPQLLSDALAVSFDPAVGHDYLEEWEQRHEFYHRLESKLPFDLDFFNRITKGGVSAKTLNVILAGTGVGKSLFMCHLAAHYLSIGKKVLYITLEMAEERIAERIDANYLNVSLDDLKLLSKEQYEKKIAAARAKTKGDLIIKEFPTAGASTIHFEALLNELKLKKDFVPDVVFVDYINICVSSRIRMGGSVNSYSFIKAIAEELRGLAVKFKIPLWTATQTNRDGFDDSDVSLTNTAESFGLPHTVDFMFAMITNEQLEQLGQFMVKQLKNRYNDVALNKKFVIGVDRPKMRLFDVSASAQTLVDSGQKQEKKEKRSGGFKPPEKKNKFAGLKVE